MKIVKFIKKKNGIYKLIFENDQTIDLHEDLILKEELLLNREIADNDIKRLLEINKEYLSYSMAIKYLGSKMRSIKELKLYLKKKEVSDSVIDDVVSKLVSEGYLNDYNYAKAFVNDKITLSNDGPLKIKKSLEDLNISSNTISDVLVNFTDEIQLEKINKLVLKYAKSNSNKGEYLLKQKIYYNLSLLGYDKVLIQKVLDEADFNCDDLMKKEYDKLYKKLSSKYSGSELEYMIKQKLYQKGFKVK